MDQPDLISHVARLVDQCEDYLAEQSKDRERALEYYNGEMSDMKPDEGRSSVVSKDVRAVIKKLMPSIMRSILSNDRIVDYEPVGQEDEQSAQQATDYVNHVVVPECGAEQAIYDAVFDALLLKTGVLKWSAYKRLKSAVYEFTDQSDDDVLGLFDDPDNEIFDHEKTEETDAAVLEIDPNARRHSFKLRRIEEQVDVRLEAVPRGSFLIYPGADTIDDAPIVGERLEMSRSDLVSMGYNKDDVFGLMMYTRRNDEEDDQARMGADWTDIEGETTKALETVVVYEVYVKLDQDGDGIAEMYRIVFGDTGEDDRDGAKHIVLDMEPVAEAPYSEVVAERDAHQFEGHSIFEDTEDIQRIKTALLRGTLDNVYWQNNPQPAVDLAQVEDPEAIYNPEFGKPVLLKSGADAQRALQWLQIPFVGEQSFGMLSYFDEMAKDRTGITDASGGVDPEAFQQMTATSAQLMSEAGIAQADMIIRSLTRGGIRKAFRGLLKLVIAHHDQPRTVRIRGEWVQYDPAHWNVDMDCTVNVGLGAGSRERDMSVLQIVLGLQKELLASIGPDNPYVKPDQLYNTLEKMTETAGFPSAEPYFTKPDPQEIAAKLQAQQNKPDPQTQKVQAQMQLEQTKAQARQQVEEAQMQADLQVREREQQLQLQIEALKGQLAYLMHTDKMQLEAAKAGLIAPQMPQVGLPDIVNG
ncbi:portal protein [Tateyamaria sp.]|uniref:portal protein n=1 Tax=Tateyamaria sp. TaxID=1929288 RepID=UPI003B20E9F8